MSDGFFLTYDECRARFLQLAHRAGARVERLPIAARGPERQQLTIDVAQLGAQRPRRIVAVQSGTHGVEGFTGSAIQQQLLADAAAQLQLPPDAALLLVHAVNPYGFAWWRRANESNVDLNRNFVDWREPRPRRPDYERLHPLLCPSALGDEDERVFRAQAEQLLAEKGMAWLERAITEGQYAHPEGLYYGGAREEESLQVLRRLYRDRAADADELLLVDLHTGLGAFGSYTLLSNHPAGSAEHAFLEAHFDPARLEVTIGNESRVTAEKHGQLARGVARDLAGVAVRSLTFELGTHPPERILLAERRENWLHHYGDRDSALGRAIAWEHRECSCPDSEEWRRLALAHGSTVVMQALRALDGAR